MHTQDRVLFIVPRFHTNLIGWISGLSKIGVHSELWVTRFGQSENYSLVTPISINELKNMSRKKKFNRQLFVKPFFWNLLSENQPNFVVVRFELDIRSIYYFFCIFFSGFPFLIYSQWPVQHLSGIRRFIRFILTDIFRASIISPVWSRKHNSRPDIESGKKNSRVHFIPFAIEVEEDTVFNPKTLKNTNLLRVLSVGKYQIRKNHDQLVNFFLNSKVCKTFDWELTILGENSNSEHQKYFKRLQKQVLSSSEGHKIRLLENFSHTECLSEISRCDLFVILSESEPASVSNLEAMSLGKAIVVNADNGTANYFRNNLGGYLVQSATDLEGVMTDILHNRDMLLKMGIRNQEDCRNLYDSKKVAQKMVGILREL